MSASSVFLFPSGKGSKKRTESPVVLEGRVEAHDTGMASSEGYKSVAFCNGGMHLVILHEVGFLEDFDSIQLASSDMGCFLHLLKKRLMRG